MNKQAYNYEKAYNYELQLQGLCTPEEHRADLQRRGMSDAARGQALVNLGALGYGLQSLGCNKFLQPEIIEETEQIELSDTISTLFSNEIFRNIIGLIGFGVFLYAFLFICLIVISFLLTL